MDATPSSTVRIGGATAVAALLLGLGAAVGTGVAAAQPAVTGSAVTAVERDEILAQHNMFRAEVGQAPLVWDNALATGAQEWADAKQADGKFEHATTNLGENLAGGEVKDATMRLATGVGVTPPDDERANYQTDPQPTGQEKKVVGHYTQIVWSSTTSVGCGFAPRNRLAFGLVVCRYSPPGNFRGQFPYPPGTTLVPQPGLPPVADAAGGAPGGAPPVTAQPATVPPPGTAPPASVAPDTAPPDTAPPAGTAAPAVSACPNADASGLAPSATEEAVGCLIANARSTAGLTGHTISGSVRTVAEAIAQGTRPPDLATALTSAGYCPGSTITSWNYSSAARATPQAAFDYFVTNAPNIVTGPVGDLGVGAAAGRVAVVLAQCG